MNKGKILIVGASGYIGSQLAAKALEHGFRVRAASRSLDKIKKFSWADHPHAELKAVDVLDVVGLKGACQGCETVFYLVHSMNPQHKDFAEADRKAARNMVAAAAGAGVKRIVYLGGLGDDTQALSRHLRSRMEVSRILHAGRVPVTTLRAAMIIGKGSISFEILRHLVDRLPVMVTPLWVHTKSQPIAVTNVIEYLIGCIDAAETANGTFDIGGPDILSYRQLMDIYAEEARIGKRWIIPVPVLTPTLSSYWIQLITPYPTYIAKPLTEGLRNRVVCREHAIRKLIPQKLLTCREAIRAALDEVTV